MSDVTESKLRELAAYSGDPWDSQNAYFALAEPHMARLWGDLVFPFIKECDFTETLDLAAGIGRNSAILVDLAKTLSIMDIQPGNIEACRQRFAGRSNVSCYVNNGFDLRPAPDESLTLVYCFDAMVHFDSDIVRSYLRDTRRVLKPGGRGFFHHSNYTGGYDWKTNPESRNFMSKAFFAHYAQKEGLIVLAQQEIQWSGIPALDCLTLVGRPVDT